MKIPIHLLTAFHLLGADPSCLWARGGIHRKKNNLRSTEISQFTSPPNACVRKPEYPERIHTGTCNLHTEKPLVPRGFQPGTFLLWGDNANHYTTPLKILIYKWFFSHFMLQFYTTFNHIRQSHNLLGRSNKTNVTIFIFLTFQLYHCLAYLIHPVFLYSTTWLRYCRQVMVGCLSVLISGVVRECNFHPGWLCGKGYVWWSVDCHLHRLDEIKTFLEATQLL